jgi:hypothetical protein
VPKRGTHFFLCCRSLGGCVGTTNYASKIKKSFQAFLDDYTNDAMQPRNKSLVEQMINSNIHLLFRMGNLGTAIDDNQVSEKTWNITHNCIIEYYISFQTPPCFQQPPHLLSNGPVARFLRHTTIYRFCTRNRRAQSLLVVVSTRVFTMAA